MTLLRDHPYDVHVMPMRDLREHYERRDCWCKPTVDEDDAGSPIIVHNSADRREHTIEKGRVQ